MSETLFAFLKGSTSITDDTDPEVSAAFKMPPWPAKHNVINYRGETVYLDEEETRVVTPLAYTSSAWVCIMARVIGSVKLTTVGVNWDGSTPIEGITAGYGTPQHPGMISMVTSKTTSFTLEGLEDNSEVQYLVMTLATDAQL